MNVAPLLARSWAAARFDFESRTRADEFLPDTYLQLLDEQQGVDRDRRGRIDDQRLPDGSPFSRSADEQIAYDTGAQFVAPLYPVWARPVSLRTMRESGQAGLLTLSNAAMESILRSAKDVDAPPEGRQTWMETIRLHMDWLLYPQDSSTLPRFLLWLPVRSQQGGTRLETIEIPAPLQALNQGAGVTAVNGSGCASVLDGDAEFPNWKCDRAGCSHPCTGRWGKRGGIIHLLDCDC